MEGTEDFDKAEFGLVPIRVDTLGPFLFANLDSNAAPLADWIGAIPSAISSAGYEMSNILRVEPRDSDIGRIRQVSLHNYLPAPHLPTAHPAHLQDPLP